MPYTVTMRRNADGLERDCLIPLEWEREDPDSDPWFWWLEGNGGCDCNRAGDFAGASGEPIPDVPCGDEAFTLLRVTLENGTVLLPPSGPDA